MRFHGVVSFILRHVQAIFRSRKIFQRMRNYCIYRISCTIQLLCFFFFAIMAVDPAQNNFYGKMYPDSTGALTCQIDHAASFTFGDLRFRALTRLSALIADRSERAQHMCAEELRYCAYGVCTDAGSGGNPASPWNASFANQVDGSFGSQFHLGGERGGGGVAKQCCGAELLFVDTGCTNSNLFSS